MLNRLAVNSALRSIEDRVFRLNKKIDILYTTARESMMGSGIETYKLNRNKLEPFIQKFDDGGDVYKLYHEWKQDLMIRYFDPRNYRNRV